MESFFGTIKTESLHHYRFDSATPPWCDRRVINLFGLECIKLSCIRFSGRSDLMGGQAGDYAAGSCLGA
jgi:hypothetical protein